MIHDFGLLNGLAEEPAVRSLFAQAAAELKQYLQIGERQAQLYTA
jgi:hypothetical protein